MYNCKSCYIIGNLQMLLEIGLFKKKKKERKKKRKEKKRNLNSMKSGLSQFLFLHIIIIMTITIIIIIIIIIMIIIITTVTMNAGDKCHNNFGSDRSPGTIRKDWRKTSNSSQVSSKCMSYRRTHSFDQQLPS